MLRMKKSSFFLVLLFLLGLAISEIPEQIRLSDDVSNDFVLSACGTRPVQISSIKDAATPASRDGSVERMPGRTFQDSPFARAVRCFHTSGQERLVFYSIQKI